MIRGKVQIAILAIFMLVGGAFLTVALTAYGAVGTPKILSYQGRLANSSGDLLGSSSGTNYYFKFSIYDASTGGTKLWPSGAPSSMTASVVSGVFNVGIGDTSAGGDALDLDFNSDTYYLEVQVSSNNSTFETLSPRQRIFSSGYSINADTVDGASAGIAAGNVLKITSSGNISFGGDIYATSTGGSLFASSTVVSTGNILGYSNLNIYGTGTSTFSGKIEITGRSLINGSSICTASNGICSAASAGGWTDDGTIVRLTAITDSVGIGTTTPGGKLGVQGIGFFSGNVRVANLTATGTITTLGSATSTFTGGLTVGAGGLASTKGLTVTGGVLRSSVIEVNTATASSTWSDGIAAKSLSATNGFTVTGGIIRSSGIINITGAATSTMAGGLSVTTGGFATSDGIAISGGAINFAGDSITDLVGTGLQVSGGALTLNATGDWTGTLDGIEGASFLRSDAADEATGLLTLSGGFVAQGSSTVSDMLRVTNGLFASSTLYSSYTGTSTFLGGLAAKSLSSTNGLTLTGGVIRSSGIINLTGTATSTFAGGLNITGGGIDIELPSCSGSNALTTDAGGGVVCGAITASAGGTDTQVQFNDGGSSLGGDAGLTYNKTTNILTLSDGFIGSGSSTIGTLLVKKGVYATSTIQTGGHFRAYGSATSTFTGGLSVGSGGLASSKGLTLTGGAINFAGDSITDLVGTGLQVSGGSLTLNATGDWTGTLDGIEGASFLRSDAADEATGLLTLSGGFVAQGSSTVSDMLRVTNGLFASSTLYSSYTGTSTFLGGLAAKSLSSTNGLTLTGGVIRSSGIFNLTGSATSSMAGGLDITGGGISFGLPSCGALETNAAGAIICGTDSTGSATFPFTTNTWGNSTTTVLGFLNGFIANGTGSSTLSEMARFTSGIYASSTLYSSYTGTSTFLGGLAVKSLSSTNGLTLTGGVLRSSGIINLTGSATSTFAGGLNITGGGIDIELPSCSGSSALTTDAGGAIVCGAITGFGTMSSFTAAGDSGTNQTISDSNTLTLFGGNNINTVGANTDTININLASTLFSMGDIFATSSGAGIYASSTIVSTGNLITYGSLGVNTGDPGTKLEVVNTSSGATANQAFFSNLAAATSTGARVIFRTYESNGTTNNVATNTAAISSVITTNFKKGKGDLLFSTLRSGLLTEGMRLTDAGLLGIGSSTPGQTFSVAGSGYLTGGLGIGNATTTSGVLETSGLAYVGGVLKGASHATFAGTGTSTFAGGVSAVGLASSAGVTVTGGIIRSSGIINLTGTGTSTFAGGLSVTAGGLNFALPSCSGTSALTTDASGGVVCGAVTLSAAGGWTDDGTVVRLTTATDLVGIGTTTPGRTVGINGKVFFDSAEIRYASSTAQRLTFSYQTSATSTIVASKKYAWTIATSTTGAPLFNISTFNGKSTTTLQGGFEIENDLRITSRGNIAIGTTSPRGFLSIDKFSGMASTTYNVAGIDEQFKFNLAGAGTQIGNKLFIVNAPTSHSNTLVGELIKVADNTTLANTVRGLEVQAHLGTNTQGEHTAIAGFGRTFGVRGSTEGDAGGVLEPAGLFGETRGTTQGNAIRGYTNSLTSGALVSLFQETSTFTGNGLQMNFGGSGSFTGKFASLQNKSKEVWNVRSTGSTTIGTSTATRIWTLTVQGGVCITSGNGCPTTEVSGSIVADVKYPGSTSTIGLFDVAEQYPASEPMEPGDIAMIDTAINTVAMIKKAVSGTSTPIIGIVSTRPAIAFTGSSIILGVKEQTVGTNPLVALAGRVPVKVTVPEGEEIKKGDRIGPSNIAGVGKKAQAGDPWVGVALENYVGVNNPDGSTAVGRLLVFVNLGHAALDSSVRSGQITGSSTINQFSGAFEPVEGSLNLLGADIMNVRGILSAAGTWSIDENGNLKIVRVETEQLKVGSREKPSGITLYDTENGMPYCLYIRSGVPQTVSGTCEDNARMFMQRGLGSVNHADENNSPSALEQEQPEELSPPPQEEESAQNSEPKEQPPQDTQEQDLPVNTEEESPPVTQREPARPDESPPPEESPPQETTPPAQESPPITEPPANESPPTATISTQSTNASTTPSTS